MRHIPGLEIVNGVDPIRHFLRFLFGNAPPKIIHEFHVKRIGGNSLHHWFYFTIIKWPQAFKIEFFREIAYLRWGLRYKKLHHNFTLLSINVIALRLISGN